ncbi:MAG: MFS transporter [Nitrososphaerota archaeon]|nr:MFS transporter [Candidatus Bathyarchaeota archaeon]MDW8024057.1 MFS transporter [Nitrososphaerota archaeon]MDW8040550.1 MFS transporter [Nitrososphaerota archaeon]
MGRDLRLLLLGAAHSLNHSLFVIAPPLLSIIMADLGVSNKVMGMVSMIASFLYGFGALAGGPLGDKIGEAKTVMLFLLISGFSTFIMLAAGAAKSLTFFTLALIFMAAGASLYHPTANSLISKTFSGRVSEAMGLHGVGGTIGVVFTPTVAWFIGSAFGWPIAFTAFGVVCIFFAFLFAKKFGFKNHEEERRSAGSIIGAFKLRELWLLLIFNIAVGLFMKGVELYLPKYLQENRAVDPMWASIAYTLVLAFGVPGQWIGGKYSDKYGAKRMLVVASVGICLGLIMLLFIPIYAFGIGFFIVLYGLFFYAHQPALNALTGFLSPENQRGAVYGVFFFTSFGIGSVSQLLSGYLADLYGFDVAFYVLTVFALTALLLSFLLPDRREQNFSV